MRFPGAKISVLRDIAIRITAEYVKNDLMKKNKVYKSKIKLSLRNFGKQYTEIVQ